MKDANTLDTVPLQYLPGLFIYPSSITHAGDTTFFLARESENSRKFLGITSPTLPHDFIDPRPVGENTWLCALSAGNAGVLRARFPWLRPAVLGMATSFGFGDRLGLATPGHIRAAKSKGMAAIFAQQSVRENARTQRTPQIVLDEAMWGVFQEGWRAPWGADADHIKSRADIDAFITAGYTFFTFDPGEHVDEEADADEPERLRVKVLALPWEALRSSPHALYSDYLERSFDLEDRSLAFDESSLLRAAAKYGRSIAHAAGLYAYLAENIGGRPFEVEISVDETATPTTVHEHYFFARELQRLGVKWVSLAPRFVGLFAKGVDYIGDLEAFTADIQAQAAVARALGPYKLSLHSGSDKFSVYAPAHQAAQGWLHVKTAGTSYLEALRVLAMVEPGFFRQVLELAQSRFAEDRKSYILSVQPEKVPPAATLSDEELPGLLEDVHARQVLHVTYGSVLERHGKTLKSTLSAHEDAYCASLKTHFERHFQAFHSSPGVERL